MKVTERHAAAHAARLKAKTQQVQAERPDLWPYEARQRAAALLLEAKKRWHRQTAAMKMANEPPFKSEAEA